MTEEQLEEMLRAQAESCRVEPCPDVDRQVMAKVAPSSLGPCRSGGSRETQAPRATQPVVRWVAAGVCVVVLFLIVSPSGRLERSPRSSPTGEATHSAPAKTTISETVAGIALQETSFDEILDSVATPVAYRRIEADFRSGFDFLLHDGLAIFEEDS